MRGHNKGPIGPLDPDEQTWFTRDLKPDDILNGAEVIAAFRSMGCEIERQDLDYWAASEGGPIHGMAPGQRLYRWGEVLAWFGRTLPRPELTRKEAAEFLRGLGCQVTATTLENLPRPDDGELAANRSPALTSVLSQYTLVTKYAF
jgi:hypothetical protein